MYLHLRVDVWVNVRNHSFILFKWQTIILLRPLFSLTKHMSVIIPTFAYAVPITTKAPKPPGD